MAKKQDSVWGEAGPAPARSSPQSAQFFHGFFPRKRKEAGSCPGSPGTPHLANGTHRVQEHPTQCPCLKDDHRHHLVPGFLICFYKNSSNWFRLLFRQFFLVRQRAWKNILDNAQEDLKLSWKKSMKWRDSASAADIFTCKCGGKSGAAAAETCAFGGPRNATAGNKSNAETGGFSNLWKNTESYFVFDILLSTSTQPAHLMTKNPVLKRCLNWDQPLRDVKANLRCNKSWFLFINLLCPSFSSCDVLVILMTSSRRNRWRCCAGETAVNLRKSIRGAVNTGSNHPTTYTAGWTSCLLIALTLFLHI